MLDMGRCDVIDFDEARVAQAREHLLGDGDAKELAKTFTMLADPTRVKLIGALSEMELCVGELAATLDMTLSAISHQLRLLRDLHLVKGRREGRHVYYSLDDDHVLMLYQCGLLHIRHT